MPLQNCFSLQEGKEGCMEKHSDYMNYMSQLERKEEPIPAPHTLAGATWWPKCRITDMATTGPCLKLNILSFHMT